MPTLHLDRDQLAAVNHREGPALVLAGPGSGKTRVIVERFLSLMEEGVSPERILVLTYTRKAADEMLERAVAAHGTFAGDNPLTNYHGFAQRVVNNFGWLRGIPPGFHIADEAEKWLHMEAVLEELKPRYLWNPLRPHDFIDTLIKLFEKAKQELVTPERYLEWSQQKLQNQDDPDRAIYQRHLESAQVYQALSERYRKNAVLDFDDTILLSCQLISEEPVVQKAIRDSLQYIMVDEYQDTNYAQARMVEALSSQHSNVFVVADDDQSIYKFRGASRANLERFARLYPGHPTFVLHSNYRSTEQIVTVSQSIIRQAPPESRFEKDLQSERGEGLSVELWQGYEERSEMRAIANECQRMIAQGTAPSSIAWLFHQHAQMTAAMAALQEIGVPYHVHGGRGFFQQPEIKDLLALLIAISDPSDTQALLRCLHLPAWAVSGKGRVAILAACNESEEPLLNLHGTDKLVLIQEDSQRLEQGITTILELHERSMIDDVRDLFMEAIEVSEFLGVLELRRDLEKMQAGANLNKFGELLETFSEWSTDRSLIAALRYLNIMRNSTEADRVATIDVGEDAVALMTTHSAKGLEWPCVFISHASASNWPAREIAGKPWAALPDELIPEPAPPGDSHPDEERRLFYVASTRAKDRLVYSWSRHTAYSGTNGEAFTPFLSNGGLEVTELPHDPSLHLGREQSNGNAHVGRLALSVTELRTFRDCPRQFEYKVRYRMPTAKSVQGWYGNLIHSVLQVAGNMRKAGGAVNSQQIQQLWLEAWDTTPGPKGAHPELKDYGLNQLTSYVQSPAFANPTIASIEDRFTIAFDAADVSGRFDRIDMRDDMPTVVDYKTGPVKDEERLKSDIQVRAYALGLHQREEAENVAVEMHFLQTAEVSRAEFDAKDLGRFYAHLRHVTEDIVSAWNGGGFPARPANFRCRRCEFRTVCDEGKAAVAADA